MSVFEQTLEKKNNARSLHSFGVHSFEFPQHSRKKWRFFGEDPLEAPGVSSRTIAYEKLRDSQLQT